MANHMPEVAKMLGVELGEEFESCGFTYKLTENGLICPMFPQNSHEDYARMLRNLLIGSYPIKRKPWKPNKGNKFWYIDKDGYVAWYIWDGYTEYINYYKLGNCYRTREEAEANRDKWIAFYASDEVLEI